ncbi:MAG: hypothetical protein ACI8ZM_003789 [Crocinitomix sp.]|jgi:hypothetical protein
MANTTKDKIGEELGKAFLPLKNIVSSIDSFESFMYELGWEINVIPTPISDLIGSVNAMQLSLTPILNGDTTISNFTTLFDAVKQLVEDIQDLGSADFSGFPDLLADGFLAEFSKQMVDYLIIEYLYKNQKSIGYFASLSGLITETVIPPTGNRPSYLNRKIEWSHIPMLLSDPLQVWENVYGWGTYDFKQETLMFNMQRFLLSVGYVSFIKDLPKNQVELLSDGIDTGEKFIDFQLEIPLFSGEIGMASVSAGLALFPIPTDGVRYPGLSLLPYLKGNFNQEFELRENWFFKIIAGLDVTGGVGITMRPEEGINAFIGFDDPSTGSYAAGDLLMSLTNRDKEGNPILIFGSAGASRFEYGGLSVTGGLEIDTAGNKSMFIEFALVAGKLVIDPSEGDGFLQKILPEEGFEINADVVLGISSERGFYFKGSAGLELLLPVHLKIGPIEVKNIKIGIKVGGSGLPITVDADASLKLGPLQAVATGLGVKLDMEFPGSGGNLGPIDAALGFKPPNGIGLSIDASAVKGGGFLYFNFEEEKYAGVAELTVKDTISLKAIGILTTKLPGNDDGYSLLLLITAEFTPIQLGFGFTLNGVGGLVAINRSMNVQALRDGVKSNSIDNIMFPDDPVANAPQIISDLEQIFPIQEGRYVFGIMGLIGWGSPTLISMEIGLMLEVPSPVRLAILGVIKAILPTEEKDLLKIQINFVGIIDFEAKYITFDASIFDSRLLTFTLAGDMAFRLKWGDEPTFLFSIGGFHPSFTPPPLDLPTMQRLTINLLGGDNPRLTLTTYFAITSNTVQFGAAVDFYLKITNKIKVLGGFGFDVLIQFSPFYLRAEIYAMLAVLRNDKALFSITLYGMLEGPSPWHAQGKAEFKVLGIKLKANFDKTFGENTNTALPDIDVLPKLVEEAGKNQNWEGEFPTASNLLVTLKDQGDTASDIILTHPNGSLQFNQKVVPLDVAIAKFGKQNPVDFKLFSIEMTDGGGIAFPQSSTKDFFAPAEFYNLTDSQKLSRKSFEKMNAGTKATGSDAFNSGYFVERQLEYEHIVYDSRRQREHLGLFAENAVAFQAFVGNNAAANAMLGTNKKPTSNFAPAKVSVAQEGYVIANLDDLSIRTELGGDLTFASQAEAEVALQSLCESQPELLDQIDIVSTYELV